MNTTLSDKFSDGFEGPPEWLAAGLQVLGVSQDQAITMIEQDDRAWTAGRITVRVCARCVRGSGCRFPAPVLAVNGAEIPMIAPMGAP